MATEREHLTINAPAWLEGGGEMGALIRAKDWSQTPLGDVETWPQSLRTALTICLGSRFPILLWWGPEFIKLYNDAYRPMLGAKHPRSLGQRGRDCWPEIWDIIGPMLEGVRGRGEATWSNDQMLPLHRQGFTEECYFTFTYSPIREESGSVGGVFCAVIETTERVLAVRRLATLRELAANAPNAHDASIACRDAVATLSATPEDVPFAAMYLLDDTSRTLRRASVSGLPVEAEDRLPAVVVLEDDKIDALPQALQRACISARGDAEFQLVHASAAGLPSLTLKPWPDPILHIAVLRVAQPGQERPYGALVVGLSPRRPLEPSYRDFLELAVGQVATAIANSRSREAERRQAQMLRDLDRAKTAFFTNVSHEFRTPLTLIIGPLEETLANDVDALAPHTRLHLEAMYRNALRLLKLVNTLLDFSRIEAGRADASFEPTDLADLTAQLASVFRSAAEDAGLRYTVDCPALSAPVYVDRQMWEKIVFNLLSNALKFTLRGEIAVRLAESGGQAELSVADTGSGIDPEQLPRVFERFHRLRNPHARTQEGSGIGLAISQEFARLHGGSIRVVSEPARGSVFTVAIPFGYQHLPADRVRAPRDHAPTTVGSAAYVNEAVGWLSSAAAAAIPTVHVGSDDEQGDREIRPAAVPAPATIRPRLLIADDNADMREYLRRLCVARWEVEVQGDGVAALESIRRSRPDLVLADVMMPGLDGLSLVRQLRTERSTRDLPVILLSARASEEARLEGLQAGADDYLVKPFSARELLAYVEARLEIARTRREADHSLRRSGALHAIQRDTLGLAVTNAPIESLLQELADSGPRLMGAKARAAIFLKTEDGSQLRFGASSGLPERFSRETEFVRVGADSVSCGRAAFTGSPVIVRDISLDPHWQPYLPAARELDLASCWSFPIRAAEGRVLGTYAIYHDTPCDPSEADCEGMELLAQTAAVVLEHHASSLLRDTADATLRQSERWLQQALEIANASREQVESLLDAAPLGVYLVDADFRIRQANPTALKAFGQADHVDELIGRAFDDVIHRLWPPAYADEVVQLFRHTLETGEPSFTQERMEMRRDRGALEGFEWQVSRIPLPDGRPGVVCYFRDVSVHLRARAALARAEALTAGQKRALERALNGGAINEVLDILAWTGYLVFTEQACTGIFVTDPDTGIPALQASAGLSEEYLQGLQNPGLLDASPRRRAMILGEMVCIADVQTDEQCAAYRPLAEAHGLRGLWSFPIRSPDGSVLGALSVYRSVEGLPDDDDVESMRLLADTAGMVLERARVVTARERAEEALHLSNRRIQEMADAMPQLVWTSDSAGQVDYYNARAAMYDGVRSGPDGGLDWRRILHREDLAPTLAAWQAAVANRRPFSFEHRLRMTDGQYRWHLSRAEPAPTGASTGAVRWFGTATDVHELRAAREALRANEERLLEADRRKDEFIAMLAHELRNPLAPIRTGLEIIRRGAERNADLDRIGQIMDRQLTHVVRLIDDLLDASRITSGKLVLKKQPSLVQDMLDAAIEANRAAMTAAQLEFSVSAPQSPVMLEADPTRFVQVVSNLLNNATKFTPAGGRVSLSARVEGGAEDVQHLVVRVEDTGIGIETEMLPHIFDMFTQAEPGRERSQGGLGIGLALARQLVQMHGGTLTAASAGRGRGSTFEMRLPLPGTLPGPVHETRDDAPARCARRVVIIDDNADAADALAMLVTQLGGVAWTAYDGRSGIACVAERSPEIVLLDLGMPEMDGYETCRQLRESGSTACIVALTGWGNDRDKLRVLRTGFDAHLTKPADPLQLEELLSAQTLPSRALH